MVIEIYLIRPDKTTLTVNCANEAALQATIASVECFKIECAGDWYKKPQIDNGIKRFANRGAKAVPLRKGFFDFTFQNILLGNPNGSETENTKAQRRIKFMDYALFEWPKVTGVTSQLAFFNNSSGSYVWKGTYAGGTAYSVNDCVYYSTVYYYCIQAGTGQTPNSSPSYWTAFVANPWVDWFQTYKSAAWTHCEMIMESNPLRVDNSLNCWIDQMNVVECWS